MEKDNNKINGKSRETHNQRHNGQYTCAWVMLWYADHMIRSTSCCL